MSAFRIIQEGPLFYIEKQITEWLLFIPIRHWSRHPEPQSELKVAMQIYDYLTAIEEGKRNPKQVWP